jgi:hypothetical protein
MRPKSALTAAVAAAAPFGYLGRKEWPNNAPVAQLDRALPSEGRGHKFESCRVRHRFQSIAFQATASVLGAMGG